MKETKIINITIRPAANVPATTEQQTVAQITTAAESINLAINYLDNIDNSRIKSIASILCDIVFTLNNIKEETINNDVPW